MGEPRRTAGCARCGQCCERIHLSVDPDTFTPRPGTDAERDIAFIRAHWRPDAVLDGEQTYTCDRFDPDTRECTAHGERPPLCANYPWYGTAPVRHRAVALPSRCSYLGDVPPAWRPEGAQPLIPIEAVHR